MEINQTDNGKDKKGFYTKYEMPKYDGAGRKLSDFKIKKAIAEFMAPVPVKIVKKKDTGYFEAHVPVSPSYRSIFCPVLS